MKFAVRHIIKFAATACAAFMVSAASPAFANTANANTSADIIEPVREARNDDAANNDQRFKSLFAGWTALERTTPTLGMGADATAFADAA